MASKYVIMSCLKLLILKVFIQIFARHDFTHQTETLTEEKAVVKALAGGRCEKLIVILSKALCDRFDHSQDAMNEFIRNFGKSLEIGELINDH